MSLARRSPLRTVVCTIHQPSSDITELFDDFMLLAKGGSGDQPLILNFLGSGPPDELYQVPAKG